MRSIENLTMATLFFVAMTGSHAQPKIDEALVRASIVDSATDVYYNVEVLKRLNRGDVDGAKNLINQAICADQAELEQLQLQGNISHRDKQMADKVTAYLREFKKSSEGSAPLLCLPVGR